MKTVSRSRTLRRALVAALLLIPSACSDPAPAEEGGPVAVPRIGGAVTASTPEAASIGAEILRGGGNAADAAVGAAFALMVSDPVSAGLGARARVLVVPGPSGTSGPTALGATLPASVRPGTAISPSAPAVLFALLDRFGRSTLPAASIVAPAAELARNGIVLGPTRHRALVRNHDDLRRSSALSELFLDANGSIGAEGSPRSNERLAQALETLAEEGAAAFSTGSLGASLSSAIRDAGGSATPPRVESESVVRRRMPGGDAAFLIGGGEAAPLTTLRALHLASTTRTRPVREGPNPSWARVVLRALALAGGGGELPPTPGEFDAYRSLVPEAQPVDSSSAPRPQPRTSVPTVPDPGPGGSALAAPGELSGASVVLAADDEGTVVIVALTLGPALGSGQAFGDGGFVLAGSSAERVLDEGFLALVVQSPSADNTLAATAVGSGGEAAAAALFQVLAAAPARTPDELGAALAIPRVRILEGGPGRVFLEGVPRTPGAPSGSAASFWGAESDRIAAAAGFPVGDAGSDPTRTDGLSAFFGVVHTLARGGAGWTGSADPRGDGATEAFRRPAPADSAGVGGTGPGS